MDFIIRHLLQNKKKVVVFSIILAVLGGILSLTVTINYNMVDYLPSDAKSTTAISVMKKEFTQSVPNGQVMLTNVSIQEVIEYKDKLRNIEGITEVLWLDDVIDITIPLEFADKKTVENYYKDGNALVSITTKAGNEIKTLNKIYEVIGEKNSVSGDLVDLATQQSMAVSEPARAMMILVPIIIIILLIATTSYIEPILFLLTIGVAILINLGSNILLGEISFITQAISPILQMAVSLDYAIFLLHSYEDYKKQTDDLNEAMRLAIKRSFSAIMASAATTLFGFIALMFMDFKIGSDLGINLVKGIVFSFLSVMVFLPALTLCFNKWIEKTKHKKVLSDFKNIGKRTSKLRIAVIIIVAIIIVPSFLAQGNNTFIYGMGSNLSSTSRSSYDTTIINETFGKSTVMVLLVPKGDNVKEEILCDELEKAPHVTNVVSYTNTVGSAIPTSFLSDDILNQFYSENYSRIILYTDTETEGEIAFSTVENIEKITAEYYGNDFLSLGNSVNLYDLKNVVEKDTSVVNLIAIIAITLVLLLTFKSISLPLLLLLTIETSIWINLSVPYFAGNSLCYIGYLVISTVQLGATVDYAILLTDHYMNNRKEMSAKEAIRVSLGDTAKSIFVSGSILASAGFCLGIISSDQIISELGILLGRGAVLSVIMVILFLPTLLLLFDKLIPYTTLKHNFFKGGNKIENK